MERVLVLNNVPHSAEVLQYRTYHYMLQYVRAECTREKKGFMYDVFLIYSEAKKREIQLQLGTISTKEVNQEDVIRSLREERSRYFFDPSIFPAVSGVSGPVFEPDVIHDNSSPLSELFKAAQL